MSKDDLLARARVDYKDNDPMENEVSKKAFCIGVFVAVILCITFFFLKLLLTKQADLGLWALVFASSGAEMIYRGRKLEIRKSFIGGIICCTLAFAASLLYIIMIIVGRS